jgi:hypothetical protein
MSISHERLPTTVPLVVQVGFAGSRQLQAPGSPAAHADEELLATMIERLRELPARLALSPQHLLCGVSQLATGADMLFARALQALALPHRVLLPQPPQAFLGAGAPGEPDFTPQEQNEARAMLASSNIAEVRVASDADGRHEQFEDTNEAIVRESDVLVCLLRPDAVPRPGGTRDLAQRAQRSGKAVWLLEVEPAGSPTALSPWRPPADPAPAFVPPAMPAELAGLQMPAPQPGKLPRAGDYIDAIRKFASAKTRRHSGGFRRAALAIILLHIAATVLAAVAGGVQAMRGVALLLAVELLLIAIGLSLHHGLHRSLRGRSWAVARLLAETLRSMKCASLTAAALDYPQALAYPPSFSPVLRTAALLHGLDTRHAGDTDWRAQRARYLEERLTGPHGQLRYFGDAVRTSSRQLRTARAGFWFFSGAAFVATGAKLAAVLGLMPPSAAPLALSWGGLLAITLPVAAVGFLSWAAASDLDARVATYAELQAFLTRQVRRLQDAASGRDFVRLVRETELAILSETLGWFSRRLFRSVA